MEVEEANTSEQRQEIIETRIPDIEAKKEEKRVKKQVTREHCIFTQSATHAFHRRL
jgi:hypothetical protein